MRFFEFDITDKKHIRYYYYWSIITEVLIHLRDLLHKLDGVGKRIDFKDDIDHNPTYKIKDVTDLITYFRDAACHNESHKRRNKKGYLFAANVYAAWNYPDDITLLMGDFSLLVKRHLVRAYRMVLERFSSLDEFLENEDFQFALKTAQVVDESQGPDQARNTDQ